MGLALLHRYSNKREGTRFEHLYGLLSPELQQEAEVLGKAMRFGAMLWMQTKADFGEFRFKPKKRHLELRLSPEAEPLLGEVAQARLVSLAQSLDSTLAVRLGHGTRAIKLR